MSSKKARTYMNVNVILTFNTCGGHWKDTQEIIDIKLVVSKKDEKDNAYMFMENKFFHRIAKACIKFDRSPKDLIKISTCSEWDTYQNVTGNKSLDSHGHSCKWYFGNGRKDLDQWEKHLMVKHGFGTNADMSYPERIEAQLMGEKVNLAE